MPIDGSALVGELLALRAVTAALAREVLLNLGSEAFIRLEAQAKQFAGTPEGRFPPAVVRQAQEVLSDIFQDADDARAA
jgi:hypothetical protein